jgi:Ca2+-binding EF-hand superfamily protein
VRAVGQNPSMSDFSKALVETNLANKNSLNHDDCVLLAQRLWSDDDPKVVLEKSLKKISKREGYIDKNDFKEQMMNRGERLNQQEFDELLALVGVTNDGKINHKGEKNSIIKIYKT